MDLKAAIKITAGVTGAQAVDQLQGKITRLEAGVGTLRNAFIALGGVTAAYKFAELIKGSIDAADNLNDLSMRTGVAVEDLDALGFAAEQNGTSLDAVSGALQKMARLMGEAAGGSVKANAVLQQFGISAAEIQNGSISATDALGRIADRISQMPDGLQKAAAAQMVFGKSAAEIVPLLNAGGDAIRAARGELEQYGALITTDMARASDEFNDKLALVNRTLGGLVMNIANDLLPVMDATLQGFLDASRQADNLGRNTSIQEWARGAALALAILVDDARVAAQAITALIGSFQAVWADIKLAGSFQMAGGPLAFLTEQGRGQLKAALDERNRTVEEANQRYIDLWNMDGSKYYDAVKSRIDAQPPVSPGAREPGGLQSRVVAPRPEWNFDFAAGDKAQKAAAAHDKVAAAAARQDQQIKEMMITQQGELDLLELEGQKVNMSAHQYEMLVEAKRHEIEVARATADMLPDQAAKYKTVADGIFQARQALEEYNYQQSRTFEYGAKQAFQDYIDQATNAADQANKLFSDAFSGMEDALVEFVKTGKLDFSSLVDSILDDLARIVVQQAIMAPLMQALGVGGASNAGGLLGGLFGFADGGIMTADGAVPLRQYARGGIANSPQAAIYGEGSKPEAFVPLPDGRTIPVTLQAAAGAGAGQQALQVVVNNYGSDNVSARETRDSRGQRRIEVTVGEMVAGEIRRPGSAANQAIRQTVAAQPVLTRR